MNPETLQTLALITHPMRIQLMSYLGKKPMSTAQLTELMPLTLAGVHANLVTLRNGHVLHTARGRPVLYSLNKEKMEAALLELMQEIHLTDPRRRPAKQKKAKRKKA
jgi:DNA-binding transcriptional ArsR family regulator